MEVDGGEKTRLWYTFTYSCTRIVSVRSLPVTQIVIDVPASLIDLPDAERNALLRAGLFEAVHARIRQLQQELDEAQAQLARFELHFGCSLAQFEIAGLPANASPADHDAYLDWVYWQAVADEKAKLLAAMKS